MIPGARAILVADRNRRNLELLSGVLGAAGFEPHTIATLEELDRALGVCRFWLALVDAASFDPGLVVERLAPCHVPLLVFSDRRHLAYARRMLAQGARCILEKPLFASELLAVVRSTAEGLHESDLAAHRP